MPYDQTYGGYSLDQMGQKPWRTADAMPPPMGFGGQQPAAPMQPDPHAEKDAALQQYMSQGGASPPTPAGYPAPAAGSTNGLVRYFSGQQPPSAPNPMTPSQKSALGQMQMNLPLDPYAAEQMRQRAQRAMTDIAEGPPSTPQVQGQPVSGPIPPQLIQYGSYKPFMDKSTPEDALSEVINQSAARGNPDMEAIRTLTGMQHGKRELDIKQQQNDIAERKLNENQGFEARVNELVKQWQAANPTATAADLASYERQAIDYVNKSRLMRQQAQSPVPGRPPSGPPPQGLLPGGQSGAPAPAGNAPPLRPSAIDESQQLADLIGSDLESSIRNKTGVNNDELFTRLFRADRDYPGLMQKHGDTILRSILNARGSGAVDKFMNPGPNFLGIGAATHALSDDTDVANARAAMRHYMGKTKPTQLGLFPFAQTLFAPHAGMAAIPGSPADRASRQGR